MATFARPARPTLSPGRRSSHPPGKNQAPARPTAPVKRDAPFDPDELARRLEETRLQIEASKARRLKRSSLCIGNNGEPSVPARGFVPPDTIHESGGEIQAAKNSSELQEANRPKDLKRSLRIDTTGPSVVRASSQIFKPSTSISAFLATTSPRSPHSQPHTLVYEELHNEPQHPNPYYPGLENNEDTGVAVQEIDEAQDIVEVSPSRPALRPQDRPDWTQRSQCGEDFSNRQKLLRFKSKRDLIGETEDIGGNQGRGQPYSAQEILSRRTQSVRILPGCTHPELNSKSRSSSYGDPFTNVSEDTNRERRISPVEMAPTRNKKSSGRRADVMPSRQDGVTAAERHRDWLEQLREQERNEAPAKEREQEMLNAKKKAKRKASFRWTLLDKMKEIVH